jgi:uroporphyrinogen decarboxylase
MREITPRERFKAVMNFEKTDRLPWFEWPYTEVIIRWIEEGLPIREILKQEEVLEGDGSCPYSTARLVFDVSTYFGFENFYQEEYNVIIDQGPLPRFPCKTLKDTEEHKIIRSVDGTTKEVLKENSFYMPMWLDWPVKNEDDWEKFKVRFDPNDPRRYPKDWGDELIDHFKNAQFPVVMWLNGFFMKGRECMGTIPFVTSFYKNPKIVKDIMDFHRWFTVECIKEAVEILKSNIDIIIIGEDIAYKHGPHISPNLFREFILPNYKELIDFLRRNGIKNIFVDSDGNIIPLIPLFIEAGVNGFLPLEVASGVDAVALRKEYGKSILLIGNIDKRAIIRGEDAIEREVSSKLPYLKKEGGYIPMIDHVLSPDIPLKNFKDYTNCMLNFL